MACAFAAYPLVSNYLADENQSVIITEYAEVVADTDDAEAKQMIQDAAAYNEILIPTVTETERFSSEYMETVSASYYDLLNINDKGMMGYIEIPKINVYLPIYHGTDATTLETGVGHVVGTSLPVGGLSTHCVISAHSGLSTQRMFSDIDEMVIGDVFYLHVLNDTMAYKVCDINTVLPEDLDRLDIQTGRDLCTLITCTPFGVNTHRLLVTGERTEYIPEEAEQAVSSGPSIRINTWAREYLKGVLIGLLCAVALILLIAIILREKTRRERAKKLEVAKNGNESEQNPEAEERGSADGER